MPILTGLDVLTADYFRPLYGKSIGIVCNQASLDSESFDHIAELLRQRHVTGKLRIKALFGPQHGIFGETQDNMIEWKGGRDDRTGIPVYSLYDEHREPTDEMLQGIDLLVIDLPDVGSRYYTFQWTMALCIKACERLRIPVMVLDRPNPIGGTQTGGTVLEPEFSSFVGLYPMPMRPGLTLGEVGRYLVQRYFPRADLTVVPVQGWTREQYHEQTNLHWLTPSPNMPWPKTAMVYPGACLLEATNMSEGRGTTRPFETFGAPYLDGHKFAEALNALVLAGCKFRPVRYEPTFNKHAGKLCEGAFLFVTDRCAFDPTITYVAVIQEAIRQAGLVSAAHLPILDVFHADSEEMRLNGFAWRQPPYEYEREKLPIDILAGNHWLRKEIEALTPIASVAERFAVECAAFEPWRCEAMIY